EENEHIATQVERVAGVPIRTRGDECLLGFERDHPHLMSVEMGRGPHTKEESGDKDQPPSRDRTSRDEGSDSQNPVDSRAEECPPQSHDDDAEIVKDALEQSDDHSPARWLSTGGHCARSCASPI